MKIIENTEEARKKYGFAYGVDAFEINNEQLEALKNGKCLAEDINGEEYVLFLTLSKK